MSHIQPSLIPGLAQRFLTLQKKTTFTNLAQNNDQVSCQQGRMRDKIFFSKTKFLIKNKNVCWLSLSVRKIRKKGIYCHFIPPPAAALLDAITEVNSQKTVSRRIFSCRKFAITYVSQKFSFPEGQFPRRQFPRMYRVCRSNCRPYILEPRGSHEH